MSDNAEDRQDKIVSALSNALGRAEEVFLSDPIPDKPFTVSDEFYKYLSLMSDKASAASAAFTNLVTGLAIKIAYPDVDVRYHQIQIQNPEHFNHRGVSEQIVYPWLRDHDFDYAKSGWQTRTLERPKPYFLGYDENISHVKEAFLGAYDQVEEQNESTEEALSLLLLFQVILRNKKQIDLIEPKIDEIATIISFFENHFFAAYRSKGASRLPVLAIYALYGLIMPQLARYDGVDLAHLELHSAADSQTGSTGDIEITREDGSVFEAIEIKHNIPITEEMIADVARKLVSRKVDRYYILTTHKECGQTDEVKALIKEMKDRTGCQIIANGVLPTIRYYLRLVNEPSEIFPKYVEMLKTETAISHDHRVEWNEIVLHSAV
jgi:DNA (cytosine-5)-methyltransferase 1